MVKAIATLVLVVVVGFMSMYYPDETDVSCSPPSWSLLAEEAHWPWCEEEQPST